MNDSCQLPSAAPTVASPPVEWCAGNKVIRWENGRITERPRTSPIPDGTYANATLVMSGGCIDTITEGTNVVFSACDPCAVPPPPPPTVDIPISAEACNLTTIAPDGGLLTTLTVIPTSNCLGATGCGTTISPLLLDLRISPDPGNSLQCRSNGLFASNVPATSGVNFIGCGISIQNGLWTALATPFAPVLDIISSDGSVTINRPSDCVVDITGAVLSPGGVGNLVITNYNTSADLPTTNAANPVATVGTVNPRQLWIFVTGFGWRQVLDSLAASLQINL